MSEPLRRAPSPAPALRDVAPSAPAIRPDASGVVARAASDVEAVQSDDPSAPQPAARPRPPAAASGRRAARLLAAASALYLAGALFVAVQAGLVAHGLWALGAAACVVAAMTILSRIRFQGDVLLVLAVSFVAQMAWAHAADARPFGEFGVFWAQARSFADGFDLRALVGAASPGGVAFWGAAIALFGDALIAARAVAALLWCLQTWLIWRIAREIPEARDAALAAAAIIGLAPAVIAFGGVASPEAVFGPLVAAALYIVLSQRRRGLVESAAISGALVGAAVLVRPVGLCFLFAIALVLTSAAVRAHDPRPRRRLVLALGATLVGFAAMLSPYAALTYAEEERIAPLPSTALGYQLLLGTNRESVDGYSLRDLERAGLADASSGGAETLGLGAAIGIAAERIAEDPVGFLGFVATEKMRRLWSSEREALSWSLDGPSNARAEWLDLDAARMAQFLADGFLIATLAAAAFGAGRLAHSAAAIRDPTRWMLIFGGLLALAAAHAPLEGRERDHLVFLPFLAALAPVALARLQLVRRWRGVGDALRRGVEQMRAALGAGDAAAAVDAARIDADPADGRAPASPFEEEGDGRTRTAAVRS